jgi:fructose-1-phosphate kinase PfkB-like protein
MLLAVSPNLAVDRILEVDGFRPAAVQRSRAVCTQPGGKGSNVARVFRQLGGEVVLVGFVGKRNAGWIVDPPRSIGVTVDGRGYSAECRTSPEPGSIVSDEIGGLYTQTSVELW